MRSSKQQLKITCIYCGFKEESSREHVVQDSLGGVDVLTTVCANCNEAMSGIDDVLSVKSPLSLLARRELNGTGPNSWDVDEARNGLLLEARQTPGSDSMTVVPQVIFDGSDRLVYCDGDDLNILGADLLQARFYSRLRRAYDHFKVYGPSAKKKDHKSRDMLKLRQVKIVRGKYRFPPRICCRQGVTSLKKAVMFELCYHAEEDCHRTLDTLSKLNWDSRATASEMQLGWCEPEIHFSFSLTELALAPVSQQLLPSSPGGACCHPFKGTRPDYDNEGPPLRVFVERREFRRFAEVRCYGNGQPRLKWAHSYESSSVGLEAPGVFACKRLYH